MDLIDVESLIVEIQNRPLLWDRRSLDFRNTEKKNRVWYEVLDIFIPGFQEMSPAHKKNAGMYYF